jgi:hypothetical protein
MEYLAGAHGAIKAYCLVLTTRTRAQTVLLHPYTRKPKEHSRGAQQTQGPLEQMDNPWSRQEPKPPSRATPEALYSGTASSDAGSDAGCTAVRGDPSGVYICTEGAILPVQLYGLSGTVCTCVRME